MGAPAMTNASNVDEGQEVRIGGRWQICEGVAHQWAPDGGLCAVTLWLDGIEYPGIDPARQLAVA